MTGSIFFNGPLAPWTDKVENDKIMAILDRRVITVVFGDNANLSISVARHRGAAVPQGSTPTRRSRALRDTLERFLDDQQEGYAHLYDARAGMFSFGWDASRDQFLGWRDEHGSWRKGYMDYLGNEFRGPTNFVVLRFGLPTDASEESRLQDQAVPARRGGRHLRRGPLGRLGLPGPGTGPLHGRIGGAELEEDPGKRGGRGTRLCRRNRLPGFLSESYTGDGTQYTGAVGIPDIAVTPLPRITNARVALHAGDRLHDRAGQDRAVPRRQLAGRLQLAHRSRPLGRLQPGQEGAHPRANLRPYPLAGPRPARRGAGKHAAVS